MNLIHLNLVVLLEDSLFHSIGFTYMNNTIMFSSYVAQKGHLKYNFCFPFIPKAYGSNQSILARVHKAISVRIVTEFLRR